MDDEDRWTEPVGAKAFIIGTVYLVGTLTLLSLAVWWWY